MDYFRKQFLKSSFVKAIVQPFVVSSTLAQEEVDVYTSLIMLTGRKLRKELGRSFTDSDIESIFKIVEDMSFSQRKSTVNELINKQVVNLFENISSIQSSMETERKNLKTFKIIETERLLSLVGYTVECKQSNLVNAGNGVFLRGKVNPGDVIAIYPGLVHLSEYTRNSTYIQNLLPDDDYMIMTRFDNVWIDGRTADLTQQNPYALAHKINHPASGSRTNVLQVSFDFPGDPLELSCFPEDLRHLIPNKNAKDPTILGTPDRSALMRSLVVLASEPVEDGQELYMDYRLNPEAGALPSWYSHADKAQAMRRWDRGDGEESTK